MPVLTQALFSSYRYSTTMAIIGLCEIMLIVIGLFFTETPSKSLNKDANANTGNAESSGMKIKDGKIDTRQMKTSHTNVDETTGLLGTSEGPSDVDVREKLTETSTKMQFVTSVKTVCSDWRVWCVNVNFGLQDIPFQGFKFFAIQYVVRYCDLTEAEGALGISIAGVASVLGAILLLCLAKVEFPRMYLHLMLPTLLGGCVVVMGFTNGKVMYYSIMVALGIFRGLLASTLYSVALEVRGPELFSIIYGFNYLAQGVATIATGQIFSYLQTDVNQVAGLYFCGVGGVLATLVLLPVVIHRIKSISTPTSS